VNEIELLALAAAARKRRAEAAPQQEEGGSDFVRMIGRNAQLLHRNIMGGSPPGQETPGEKLGTLLNMGGESLTFGLVGDEAAAAADAALGRGTYDERLALHREREARMEAEHPGASLAARLAPAAIPSSAVMRGVLGGATLPSRVARGAGAGAGLSGLFGFMEGEGGAEERAKGILPAAAIGAGLGGAIPLVGGMIGRAAYSRATKAGRETVPSAATLKQQAGDLYEAAAQSGAMAPGRETATLARTARDIATREGLVTPRGRIAESYPKVRDALNMLDDFAGETMTPQQMQAVRRTMQGAAGSTDKAERRIGAMLLEKFDDFAEKIAPELAVAKSLYARASKGGVIDEAIELAGIRAGQFSGSGFENALRTEFRRLARDIAKGRMRGLSKAQVEAIRRVSDGGPLENILRGIGKAAPTGIVSAGMSGGIPFLIGNAVGGPVVGALAGGGTMLAGGMARRAATAMQKSNAATAGAVMRSASGRLPAPTAGSGPGLLAPALMATVPETALRRNRIGR